MKIKAIVILIVSVLFPSCQKSVITEYEIPVEYPTTYIKISSEILGQMQASNALKNRYLVSSLNDFGFCGYGNISSLPPSFSNIKTRDEAVAKAKLFCSQNQVETGVKDSNELKLDVSSSSTNYNGITTLALFFSCQESTIIS